MHARSYEPTLGEAEKWFNKICMLNEIFGFLDPHALLRSENIEEDMNKFKNISADYNNFSELPYKKAWFKRLVQFSGTAFHSDATELHLLQWLTKYRLCKSTSCLFLCFKLYLTFIVSTASCERSFSKAYIDKILLEIDYG